MAALVYRLDVPVASIRVVFLGVLKFEFIMGPPEVEAWWPFEIWRETRKNRRDVKIDEARKFLR